MRHFYLLHPVNCCRKILFSAYLLYTWNFPGIWDLMIKEGRHNLCPYGGYILEGSTDILKNGYKNDKLILSILCIYTRGSMECEVGKSMGYLYMTRV